MTFFSVVYWSGHFRAMPDDTILVKFGKRLKGEEKDSTDRISFFPSPLFSYVLTKGGIYHIVIK